MLLQRVDREPRGITRDQEVRSSPALAEAEDAVARLDERLANSPIAEGFCARTDFADACAALHLEGELVHGEDLALHDAAADVRTPSHALTRAHNVLRARRRIAAAEPGWAGTEPGLAALRGHGPAQGRGTVPPPDAIEIEERSLDAELAAIDALIARSSRVLAGQPGPIAQQEEGRAENEERVDRVTQWRTRLAETSSAPPILAAALAGAALEDLAPFPNQPWLGRLVVADLLRARKKTRAHLAGINLGLKLYARERGGRSAPPPSKWIGAMNAAAQQGLANHDRWLNARRQLERKLVGRRSTSSLPALVDLVMRVPMVSAGVIAAELEVSPRAAQQLVAELGLREMTGRGRYRCWGVL